MISNFDEAAEKLSHQSLEMLSIWKYHNWELGTGCSPFPTRKEKWQATTPCRYYSQSYWDFFLAIALVVLLKFCRYLLSIFTLMHQAERLAQMSQGVLSGFATSEVRQARLFLLVPAWPVQSLNGQKFKEKCIDALPCLGLRAPLDRPCAKGGRFGSSAGDRDVQRALRLDMGSSGAPMTTNPTPLGRPTDGPSLMPNLHHLCDIKMWSTLVWLKNVKHKLVWRSWGAF